MGVEDLNWKPYWAALDAPDSRTAFGKLLAWDMSREELTAYSKCLAIRIPEIWQKYGLEPHKRGTVRFATLRALPIACHWLVSKYLEQHPEARKLWHHICDPDGLNYFDVLRLAEEEYLGLKRGK